MLEIPEAYVISKQLNQTVAGLRINKVTAASSPHKYAFFYEDPQAYHDLLKGEKMDGALPVGGMVEIRAGDKILLLGDGVNLRFHDTAAVIPQKHQLLIEFVNGSALSASVQMYGSLFCFKAGSFDNKYYQVAREKPSPLTGAFDRDYFSGLISAPEMQKLSVKAFLATEQRIPGFGNGVLQDIVWKAKLHPKRKIQTVTQAEREDLLVILKETLQEMADRGGRDTEKDLFGASGGYETMMRKLHLGQPCTVCAETIVKAAYLGGSVYFCPGCQPA